MVKIITLGAGHVAEKVTCPTCLSVLEVRRTEWKRDHTAAKSTEYLGDY